MIKISMDPHNSERPMTALEWGVSPTWFCIVGTAKC
jgi:hypothetical protein